ncbi:MAG TPA: polyprenol phosphomannose-dependent alpha 1,6 mannosyltransferase MptB [Solirubrobacteraceae bacterium]|nr:polyprenol phosphomannose-dependent alpha 1,6 mannosyltransferase MptB [Solirubrobacteraceae bacterium]
MSVDSPPLGATRSGAFELRAPALETRTTASRTWIGLLGLAGMLLTGVLVALAAANTEDLLPQTVHLAIGQLGLAGSFGTTGIDLGSVGLTIVMAAMFISYLATVAVADRLSPLLVLGTIAALTTLIMLAPPLVSTDIFSYQFYGRLGEVYHANPYVTGPHALALDPLYQYIDWKWVYTPTVYGPLFTAFSYVLAPLSIPVSVFAYKAIAAVSSLAIVALVWNGARLRGVNQVKAAALVGLNPLIVVYGVGGGHNDLLMLAPLMAGVVLLLKGRGRLSGGSIVAAAAVKVTAGLVLPFALADARGALARGALQRTRRRDLLIGAGVAAAALAVFSFAMFGTGPLHLPGTIDTVQANGNWQSIPGFIGTRLGLGTVGHPVTLGLAALFAGALGWLLWRVWRGRLDWIAGAGWAALALLVTAASLLPWYAAWLMPLAALGRDRRLWRASLALTVVMAFFQLLAYIPHGSAVTL